MPIGIDFDSKIDSNLKLYFVTFDSKSDFYTQTYFSVTFTWTHPNIQLSVCLVSLLEDPKLILKI